MTLIISLDFGLAQTITQDVISNGGETHSQINGSMQFNIGETFVDTYLNNDSPEMYLGFETGSNTIMEEMGQDFWSRRQPNGFSENKEDWMSTEHLDRRIRLADIIYRYGKPERKIDQIISEFDISETTKSKLSAIKNSRAKFIATLCSMDILEV